MNRKDLMKFSKDELINLIEELCLIQTAKTVIEQWVSDDKDNKYFKLAEKKNRLTEKLWDNESKALDIRGERGIEKLSAPERKEYDRTLSENQKISRKIKKINKRLRKLRG